MFKTTASSCKYFKEPWFNKNMIVDVKLDKQKEINYKQVIICKQ